MSGVLSPTPRQHTAGERWHTHSAPRYPRRITIAVDIPERLSDRSISDVCNLMASRLRYRLNEQCQAQAVERAQSRILARRNGR